MNCTSTHRTTSAWGCNCQPTPTATTAHTDTTAPSQTNAWRESNTLWLKLNAARAVTLAMCSAIEDTNQDEGNFMHGLATASTDAIEAAMNALRDLERCIQAAGPTTHHTASAEG